MGKRPTYPVEEPMPDNPSTRAWVARLIREYAHDQAQVIARSISERDFQQTVKSVAQAYGWRPYHTLHSKGSDKGFPDLVMLKEQPNGTCRLLVWELKAEQGKVTEAQAEWLRLFALVPGVQAAIMRPSQLEELTAILKEEP